MRIEIFCRAHGSFSACARNWTALPKDDLGAPRNRTFASTNKQLTLMASIHKKEDKILKELSQGNPPYPDNVDRKYRSYPDHHPSEELIVPDGLHYLGPLSYIDGCWERIPGDEEKRWEDICDQQRGLVVLTKDLNDDLVWDIRIEHGRDNNNPDINNPTPSDDKFYENLRRWIYGLMTMSDSGEMPEYPTTEDAQKHLVEQPWVRMNLKKELGTGSLDDDALRAHITASKKYLLDQLKLYRRASIYIDCAKGEGIELLKQIWPDITTFSSGEKPCISYSEKHRFIIIDSHHPSAWKYNNMRQRIPEEDYYNNMRKAVQDFFQKHHNFFTSDEKKD